MTLKLKISCSLSPSGCVSFQQSFLSWQRKCSLFILLTTSVYVVFFTFFSLQSRVENTTTVLLYGKLGNCSCCYVLELLNMLLPSFLPSKVSFRAFLPNDNERTDCLTESSTTDLDRERERERRITSECAKERGRERLGQASV